MPEILLHDTRSGADRPLVARDPGNKVGIYACGPTVYNRIHVGNARPYVVFSWLKRFLVHEGYDVTFVANVTDVNDKIYDAAKAKGIGSEELAREMTAHYVADTDALGLPRPDHEPLASETIDGIVGLIQALIDRDAAYAVEGDVYFRVRADEGYGSLSHRHIEDLDQGEGVEGADLKEDPLDFALWKAQKEGEDTAWDAPWGRGRPGWHIECSAMAEELLGVGFEVHGGGSDLVFPHHENEAAQTRLGRGAELAQIWMHNGMLEMRGEKMSKSVGNISLLPEVVEQWGSETLLLFFATAHYRQPIVFAPDTLEAARARLTRIREAARRLVDGPSPASLRLHRDAFFDALRDDFNTPRALAALAAWVTDANRSDETVGRDDLVEMLDVFGLAALAAPASDGDGPDAAALDLLAARNAARDAKDWAEADRLRDALADAGWTVRDGPDGAEPGPGMTPGGGSKGGGARGGRGRRDDDGGGRGRSKPPRDRDRAKPRTPGRGKPVPRGAEATPAKAEGGRERERKEPLDVLYGRNPVFEALRSGRREVKRIWATSGAAKEPWLDGVLLEPADGDWLTQRAGSPDHQGLVADVGPYPYADPADLLTGPAPLIVALDEIQDPRNLGAIARSAEGAGASGIVIPRHRSAEVTAAAAKASAGAVEHLKIARVRNVADYLAEAKDAGCWVYGAAAKGTPYRQPDYTGGVVLVLGAEGSGLRPRVRSMCDDVVSLPMRGRVDSLNVSAAAAVLLYGVIDARSAARGE